eukprot:CAMPEP_0117446304 /NCGR_PEP_ID=MMETSP0759-20121206/6267_1 /TAXON_ID=63605 /ORGANISM="Percolomonas cosmopolitus, Strain WS" /LENGTH=265 /DNA_ID=CAMNT_0005238557 /DNA_START=28 /DNA_END=825 /DNA_ORIENTATION=-
MSTFTLSALLIIFLTYFVGSLAAFHHSMLFHSKQQSGKPHLDKYPLLPRMYHSNWTFLSTTFNSDDPLRTIEGETFFDYESKNVRRLVELWKDECVPIWPNKNSMPRGECHFINIANNGTGTSYLRYTDPATGKLDKCCIFARPWQGIEVDFIKKFDKSESMTTKTLDWYTAGEPPAGPFTYSFWSSQFLTFEGQKYQIPFGFGFAIITPTDDGKIIPGYGTHRFYNVEAPGLKYDWEKLPHECSIQKPGPEGGPFPGYNCPFDL